MIALWGIALGDLLGWLILLLALVSWGWLSFIRSAARGALVFKWGCSAVLLFIIVLLISKHQTYLTPLFLVPPAVLLGVMWAPSLGKLIIKPLTDALDGGSEEVEAKPFYFIAEARRRKGLYQEAVAEVRKQLEKFPGNPEGMMKLAEIQADDLRDLPSATATLNELLRQPGLAPHNVATALQTLADWQLNLGRDPAAARASFERIVELFPDSPLSHNAQQRIAHLDGITRAREFRENAVFKVPSGRHDLGLLKTAPPQAAPEADAESLAAEYVQQLEKYPNDTDTREKLAMLYAEQLERLDLAVNQLEQLASLPHETPRHIAHWLDLLATLHIRHGSDMAAAENALRRITARFPHSAPASRAEVRLAALEGELKAAVSTPAPKPLGVYEKDLGLKPGPQSQS